MRRPYVHIAMALSLLSGPAMAGTIYGVKSLAPGGSELSVPPAILFSFLDTGSPSVAAIGFLTRDSALIDVDGLALSRTHGLLGFQMIGNNAAPASTLVSINTASAAATAIGSTMTGRAVRGAMFDRQNRLWALDSVADTLLRIDPTTGAILSETAITVGGLPRDIDPVSDLAQRSDGSVVLTTYRSEATGFDGPTFYTLDLDTGEASLVFVDSTPDPFMPSIPIANSGIAAGDDSAPTLLFTLDGDNTDDLFQYALPIYTRTVYVADVHFGFNAGGGDLASLAPLDIPEPMTLTLLGIGLAGLAAARRR